MFISLASAQSPNGKSLPSKPSSRSQSKPTEESRIAEELKQLEREWDDAIVRKDMAALDRIIADDFMLIDDAGRITHKKELLERIKSPDLVIKPFETEDVVVRIYGDTAILTGHFTQQCEYKGQSFTVRSRYTDVYVRRQGKWKAVSAHSSPMR
ncbi:MAG TPA: nuclear transport factor 2 family protein [Blastocatellia bacterium]|nr:nuclear transport factor 2 family protein [Blastocatellia bacterium]